MKDHPVDETGPRPTLTGALAPRWAVVGIFVILVVAALAYARSLLMPVALAFLLSLVFTPVRRFLDRRRVPSALSAFAIVGGLLALLLAGVALLSGPVTVWIDDAPTIGRLLELKVRALLGSMEAVMEAGEKVERMASAGEGDQPEQVVVQGPGFAENLAWLAPAIVAQTVFVLVLMFFLLASGDMVYEKIVHVSPTFRDKRRAMAIAYDIERKLSRYLSTITLINAGLGLCVGLAMWAIGMPNPLLIGVLAFALNYVPYLGALVGIALTLAAGLVSLPGIWPAVLAAGSYFALTSVEGNLVTPYFVGRRLKLNTVVVFLSVALWAWLWSAIGMLVATPLLVTIRTFCEHVPALKGLGIFLSARGGEVEDEEDVAR